MSGSRARLLSPRSASAASPAKSKESSARSRLCKGKEGAHGISDCRQLACAAPLLRAHSTISTAPPRPGVGSTVRPAPQMPFLPPACGEAFVATPARRARVFSRFGESTAGSSRCRQSRVASPPLLPRPSPRRRQVAQSPAGRLSPRPPPSPAQHLVSAALDRPPFLPKLGIAPGCLSDPARTTQ